MSRGKTKPVTMVFSESAHKQKETPLRKPLELVSRRNFKFHFNQEELGPYFLSNGFQDMDVAVITIAGPGRYGKSFIMNFFLRYASYRYSEGKDPKDWLKDEHRPLTGFAWEKESDKSKTCLNIWPEFFVCSQENGQKTCIIFLDTQSGDDRNTAAAEYCSIFAICSMISSVLILNIGTAIQETYLQQLEVFAEYGKMALDQSGIKPYQKLLFLVRDWRMSFQYSYGFDGGKLYLKQYFDKNNEGRKAVKELESPRVNIPNAFQDIECFLMPRLGEVATYGLSNEFKGELKAMDNNFVTHLGVLVPALLAPENLIPKTVNGQQVTVRELFVHLIMWINLFNGPTLPVPTSMFNATVEANNEAAKENALNWFKEQVNKTIGTKYVEDKKYLKKLQDLESQALKKFDQYQKMGGKKYSEPHRQKLKETLAILIESYVDENALLAHPYVNLVKEWSKKLSKVGILVGFLVFISFLNDILLYLDYRKVIEYNGKRIPLIEITFTIAIAFVLYVYLTFNN